jgi:hypothetical protein
MQFDRIYKASALKISLRNEAFRIELGVRDFPNVRFEVLVQVSITKHIFGETETGGFTTAPVLYRGHKKIYKIVYVSRMDKYKGQ